MLQRTEGRTSYVTFDGMSEVKDWLIENESMGAVEGVRDYFRTKGSTDFFGKGAGKDWHKFIEKAETGESRELGDLIDGIQAGVQQGDQGFTYVPDYGVAGSFVDMGRYVSGEPECMVEMHQAEEPVEGGNIITLVVPVACASRIKTEEMEARSEQILRAIMSVDMLGVQTELWVSCNVNSYGEDRAQTKVLIKAAGEPMVPEHVMFAIGNPAAFRAMIMPALAAHDPDVHSELGIYRDGPFGTRDEVHDPDFYPDNAVVISTLMDPGDGNKDITAEVLRKLGIDS